jgi:hypothetical protein
MELFRYSRSIYGGSNQLIGANWDLLPVFVGAAVAFIILHAILSARAKRRRQGSP